VTEKAAVQYTPVSPYPATSRDIALWVGEGVTADEVVVVINQAAGDLRLRTDLFDEFSKDGKTSYAFRLVFQSKEKTLTDDEISQVMQAINNTIAQKQWEVR
jgi:phenylalanyl-tRNA synthetase beta chain